MCWKLVIYVQYHIEQIMQIFHVYACRAVLYEERFKFLRDIKVKFRVYGLVYNFNIHVVWNDQGLLGIWCNVWLTVVGVVQKIKISQR